VCEESGRRRPIGMNGSGCHRLFLVVPKYKHAGRAGRGYSCTQCRAQPPEKLRKDLPGESFVSVFWQARLFPWAWLLAAGLWVSFPHRRGDREALTCTYWPLRFLYPDSSALPGPTGSQLAGLLRRWRRRACRYPRPAFGAAAEWPPPTARYEDIAVLPGNGLGPDLMANQSLPQPKGM
jgi:hypothetical protein